MSIDTWIHFLHILGATVWVGGGVMLLLVSARARTSTDPNAILAFAQTLRYVGLRALMPAVIVVLITGVWLVLDSAAWHFSQTWVILALALFGLAFLIGVVFLSRVGIQMERAIGAGAGGIADGAALVRRWMLGYGLVLAILLVALWDMVLKPGL
jgi:uncharacterized membrane protein